MVQASVAFLLWHLLRRRGAVVGRARVEQVRCRQPVEQGHADGLVPDLLMEGQVVGGKALTGLSLTDLTRHMTEECFRPEVWGSEIGDPGRRNLCRDRSRLPADLCPVA